MIFDQSFNLRKTPPIWFWVTVFLFSISGTFYLGLNPDFIEHWWWPLVTYNVIMGLLATFYIYSSVRNLKKNTKAGIIGSRFTLSFIKIIPILAIVPVLSFYMFSFQTIQNNVIDSEKAFSSYSKKFVNQVDGLYQGLQGVRDETYTGQTRRLLELISEHSEYLPKEFKAGSYNSNMLAFIENRVDLGWACKIALFDEKDALIAQTSEVDVCGVIEEQHLPSNQTLMINEDERSNTIQVKMSERFLLRTPVKKYLVVDAIFKTDPGLLGFLNNVKKFSDATKGMKITVNTSITQKRFLIDFSSTILLTILSVLIIVMSMLERLMRPLYNLSLATSEIAQGNYDVQVYNKDENQDIHELIRGFNNMSEQIKASREGLDTHNLYLETILKYSYGVIALDQQRKIKLINPVIGKMLCIDNEKEFIGKLCEDISKKHPSLQPLFDITVQNYKRHKNEWSEEIEILLADRRILLSCQGAALDIEDKALGYVIIIKDISQLHRAQKKAAWGEVAIRMAHEIKNPLTPILLSAQRLRNRFMDNLKDKDLEVIDKTTNIIIDQVQSMNTMVTAFADYANTPEIERKLVDLNTVINQSISLYDAQSNISINFDLSGDIPKLLLDANGISRVLINLVKNASESVEIERDLNVNIATQYLSDEGIVRLTITDDGDGFDEGVVDRVFEPYVTTKIKGSGLGMAIVQNIIEQHDGKIYAGNIEPHGAIITIEFSYYKDKSMDLSGFENKLDQIVALEKADATIWSSLVTKIKDK